MSKDKKWICNDITPDGESLIQDESGKLIAEVYNPEDVPLIKSAPDLLKALKKMVFEFDGMGIGESDADKAALFAIKQAKEAIKATGQ